MSAPFGIGEAVARIPGRAHGGLRAFFVACLAIGAIAFGLTVAANPARAWAAVNFQLTYWLTLSQAGVVLAAVFLIVKAHWAAPLQRIALGTGSFLPWAFLVLVAELVFGARFVFPWIEHPVEAKAAYLNHGFLLARMVLLVGGLMWLSAAFDRRFRRLDAGLGLPHATGGIKARFERWAKGWRGDDEEIAAARRVLPRMAAAIIPLYTVVFTVVCWDLVMSLDPHWYTTMLGGWFFMAGILMAFAALGVISLSLRRAYGLQDVLTPKRYHDLGKLIFAFSIFWTYLFWSMFLPIWYANMPEESNWMVLRIHEPYLPWSVAAIVCTWLVPFSGMMNLAAKRNPVTHLFFAGVVLVGLWIERLVLTYPSLFQPDMPIGFPEFGVTLGFLGGFGLAYQRYAASRPLVPLDRLDELAEGGH